MWKARFGKFCFAQHQLIVEFVAHLPLFFKISPLIVKSIVAGKTLWKYYVFFPPLPIVGVSDESDVMVLLVTCSINHQESNLTSHPGSMERYWQKAYLLLWWPAITNDNATIFLFRQASRAARPLAELMSIDKRFIPIIIRHHLTQKVSNSSNAILPHFWTWLQICKVKSPNQNF